MMASFVRTSIFDFEIASAPFTGSERAHNSGMEGRSTDVANT